jgi:hypothetical protein
MLKFNKFCRRKKITLGRMTMSQVELLEQNVKQLNPRELAAFRSWFLEFDAAAWDRQIEQDSQAGKLDVLAQRAMEEHKAGKTKNI